MASFSKLNQILQSRAIFVLQFNTSNQIQVQMIIVKTLIEYLQFANLPILKKLGKTRREEFQCFLHNHLFHRNMLEPKLFILNQFLTHQFSLLHKNHNSYFPNPLSALMIQKFKTTFLVLSSSLNEESIIYLVLQQSLIHIIRFIYPLQIYEVFHVNLYRF